MRLLVQFTLLLLLFTVSPVVADEAAWSALAERGTVALMRHAEAPGTLDPDGFRLGDCSSQRLLDQRGREQAKAVGRSLRERNIRFARVRTSQWCRCVETAELLAAGPVEEFPPLNSLRWEAANKEAQMAEVMRVIRSGERQLLVTHAFNISALTGISPASGEIVVVSASGPDKLEIRGRIAPP